MPAITNIRRTARDAARCSIYVDGEFFAACSIDLVSLLELKKGIEMSPELEQRLRGDERMMSLKQRAYRFATYKPRTVRQVEEFLRKKHEATEQERAAVLEWLQSFNVVDDVTYAQRFLEAARQQKPLSRVAARQKLLAKGIPAHTADDALTTFFSSEDETTMAMKVAEKKLRMLQHRDDAEQRLVRFLSGRGYAWQTIQFVLENIKREGSLIAFIAVLSIVTCNSQTLSCIRLRLPETINRFQPVTQPVLSPDGRLFVDRKLHPDNVGGANDADDVWFSTQTADGRWGDLVHESFTTFARPDVLFNFTADGLHALVVGPYSNGEKCFALLSRTSRNSSFVRAAPLRVPGINELGGNYYGFITENCNTLLLALELPTGRGDLDLYVSQHCNGVWSKPESLGPTINTQGFDGAPYLSADGTTLYFSTSGRDDRRGKSDLYMARKQNDTWTSWSKPRNLGLCVNTTEDETSLSLIGRGDSAYITSWDPETGRSGIYLVGLPDDCRPKPWCTYRNTITDALSGASVPHVEMVVAYEQGTNTCNEWKVLADSTTGQFTVNLSTHSRYVIRTTAPGYVLHKQTIGIKTIDSTVDLRLNTQLFPRTTPLLSVYFERGAAVVSEEQLLRMKEMVARYDLRAIAFEVTGYTDQIGTVPFNQTLSAQRAETVRKHLVECGLAADRIIATGRGIEFPAVFTELSENPQSRRVDVFAAEP